MSLNRRDLLKLAGVSFVLASCGSLRPKVPYKERVYSGYADGKEVGLKIISPQDTKIIPLENEIHSVAFSSKHDAKVFIPKLNLVSYYQIQDGPILALHPEDGNHFYGHGVFDDKRNVLYTTQSKIRPTEKDPGYIHVYSVPEFKLIDKFESYGGGPHDLLIVRDELIVCNGGAHPNVAHIDLSNRKLIHKFDVDLKHVSFTHCDQIDEENFVIGTTTRDLNEVCPLYHLNLKSGLSQYESKGDLAEILMRFQLLSVLSYDHHVLVTCPATNSLLVWNQDKKFVGGHNIPNVASLVYSKTHQGVIVGSGDPKTPVYLAQFIKGSLKLTALDWGQDALASGSHSLIV